MSETKDKEYNIEDLQKIFDDSINKTNLKESTIDPELANHISNLEEPDNKDVESVRKRSLNPNDEEAVDKRQKSDSIDMTLEMTLNEKPKTVIHEGIEIPADSELLNSNSAFNNYTELSNRPSSIPLMKNSHLSALPLPIIVPSYFSSRTQLLVQSLPILDNLASQLLRIFTMGPYQKVIDLASNIENSEGAAFSDLTSLFEFNKKLYSEDDPFLTIHHLIPSVHDNKNPNFFRNYEQSIESTLRKVNLSTFLLATLGIIEVGFLHLNESFLNIFCPLNSLDPLTTMCQMDSNVIQNSTTSILDNSNHVGKLLKHQAILYLDLKTQAYISAMETGDKSREEILSDLLPDTLQDILTEKRGTKVLNQSEIEFIEKCKIRKNTLLNHPDSSRLSDEFEWFQFLKNLFEFISKNMAFLIWGNKKVALKNGKSVIPSQGEPHEDIIDQDEDMLEDLLPSEIQERQLLVKSKNPTRISSRRPWTKEEERALRQALELEGPHWSNILEMFGPGGQISEALKNRNQTQLKDKARNWKMFFLKSGLPVPQYLQKVTGDLERDDRSKKGKKKEV